MRLNGKLICVRTHTIQNTTNDEVPQLSIFQMTSQTPFLHYSLLIILKHYMYHTNSLE